VAVDHQPIRTFVTESDIIAAFGGTCALSARIGVVKSAISNWLRIGIPYSRHQAIVDLARADGIPGITHERLAVMRQMHGRRLRAAPSRRSGA
jgi:hypothetical protein